MNLDDEDLYELAGYLQHRKNSPTGSRYNGGPPTKESFMAERDREKKPRLTSPPGIGCFVFLLKPQQPGENSKSKEPKYKIVLCWSPEDQEAPEWRQLRQACVAAAEEKFGKDARDKIKKGKIKMPWRPCSDYGDEGYGFPFDQEGWKFASFSSTQQPGIVDRRAKPIMKESEIYSGATFRVTYGVWPYDREGNKGVTLLLNNVQKIKDGERLAGRPDAEDDFDAVAGEDGSDDNDDDI